MIGLDEVFKIGRFIKPHGIKGEVIFEYENDAFDKTNCPYLVCLVDGILVPFFIKSYRFKGTDTALIHFEDIATEKQAKFFNGLEVYFPYKYFNPEENDVDFSLNYFIGFSVIDKNHGNIGEIIDIDDATINLLFLLKNNDNNEFVIPASDDFMTQVDEANKLLYVDLPLGLLE